MCGIDIMHIDNVYEGIKNKGKITLYTSSDAYDIRIFPNNFLNKNVNCDSRLDDGTHTLQSMEQFINYIFKYDR